MEYKIGDRVELLEKPKKGTVRGMSKMPDCIRVTWDGNGIKSFSSIHVDFVKKILSE